MNNNNIIILPVNNKSLKKSNALNTSHLTPKKISTFYQKFGLSAVIEFNDISLEKMKKRAKELGFNPDLYTKEALVLMRKLKSKKHKKNQSRRI